MEISTVDSSDPFLQLSSIPVVDLRFFSQSELNSLSLCSDDSFDLRRCDDVIVPKIDRSIFNESAGSRKQTYSRLRLARGPSDISTTLGSPRRRRGRPDLIPVPDDSERQENNEIVFFLRKLFAGENSKATPAPADDLQSDGSRKRGRRKTNSDTAIVIYDNVTEIVNRNGVVVDIAALADREDPFGPELRRRTEGLATEAELLGFLKGLEGQWGSRRKKRKIVDAGAFGDELPRGWKILLSLKRREGSVWLNCRKYISPNGLQFESCKEVSSYLISLLGPQDAIQPSSLHIYESSHLPVRSTAGLTCKDDIAKDDPVSYSVTPISSNAPIYSVSTEHEKQVVLFSSENQAKAQQWDPLECRKCKLTFDDKDAYVEHFLSFHRKKARTCGPSKSISDGVIMRDGKYECQFCHKTFDERRRYSSHVGIHVKYHGKSPEALPDDTTERKSNDQSPFTVMHSTVSELDESVCIDKDTDKIRETSTATSSDELNTCSIPSKQAMDNTAIGDSPKCSALEITQEMLVSKLVDEHEMTDGKLQGPIESSNFEDVKVEPCLDTATPLPTNEENSICDTSNEKDLFPSSMLDEISEWGNKPERDLENCSISQPDNERTCGIETYADDIFTSNTKGADGIFTSNTEETMLDEAEKSGLEQVSGFDSCSTALPDTEKTCGIDQFVYGIFTSSTKESVLDKSEKSRNELESCLGSSRSESDEVAVTEIVGSSGEENVLQNVVAGTSSLLVQQSGFFPIIDSDQGAEKFSSASQKLEKLSDFAELRLDDIEPPKFGFVTHRDSGSLSEAPMDLAYDEFEQGLDPSIQFEWDTLLPKMVGGHLITSVCVWCRVEFNLDDANSAMHSDSVGFMCPNCKAKISGQLNVLDNGLSTKSDQL